MISCKPGKQWKDLEAPDYGRFTPELGGNLAICSQMSLGRGTRGLGPLVTVLLLLFKNGYSCHTSHCLWGGSDLGPGLGEGAHTSESNGGGGGGW